MCIAGEITEYEESYLQQLILAKDPSVKEALRRYSLYSFGWLIIWRGETQSLIQLLHVYDDASDLLTKKDQEYAQYVATAKSDERIQTTNQQNRDMMIEQASIPGNTMIIIPPGENVLCIEVVVNSLHLSKCIHPCTMILLLLLLLIQSHMMKQCLIKWLV